ncbi:hypothetical protein CS542_04700 [Pedobacter sp. IW39]|nr:hypothetical protein CS542_04700 [Pedobacter sp. IW39]
MKPGIEAAKMQQLQLSLPCMEWNGVIVAVAYVIVYGIDSLIDGKLARTRSLFLKAPIQVIGLFKVINRHGLNAIATLAHRIQRITTIFQLLMTWSADSAIVGAA